LKNTNETILIDHRGQNSIKIVYIIERILWMKLDYLFRKKSFIKLKTTNKKMNLHTRQRENPKEINVNVKKKFIISRRLEYIGE